MNLILVAGAAVAAQWRPLTPFRDLPAHWRERGYRVLEPEVDRDADLPTRARQLAEWIQRRYDLDLDARQPAHMVAHGMAGLDARLLLSPHSGLRAAYPFVAQRVTSLTTIATPHGGVPVADLRANGGSLDQALIERLLPTLPLHLGALASWTTADAEAFATMAPDAPGVRYTCVAAQGRPGRSNTSVPLERLHAVTRRARAEPNDGLVPASRAAWASHPVVRWDADHFDTLGHDGDRWALEVAFPYLDRYDALVARP